MRFPAIPRLAAVLAVVVTGFSPALPPDPAAAQECARIHDVEITFEFTPKELRIQAGDCVRWTNVHDIEHSAGGLNREFATGQLMPGGRALITFPAPGDIPYWCQHHPPMQAKLVVEKR